MRINKRLWFLKLFLHYALKSFDFFWKLHASFISHNKFGARHFYNNDNIGFNTNIIILFAFLFLKNEK